MTSKTAETWKCKEPKRSWAQISESWKWDATSAVLSQALPMVSPSEIAYEPNEF